jgi:hypothetical protein
LITQLDCVQMQPNRKNKAKLEIKQSSGLQRAEKIDIMFCFCCELVLNRVLQYQ